MRGFTLIELAVTLLILALAAAVAAPSLARGVDTVRARTEAAGIATFLRAAHEQAVTRHRPYEVRVRSEEGFIELRSGQSVSACPVGKKLCTDCHMPKFVLPGGHLEFTDHRIRIARTKTFPD